MFVRSLGLSTDLQLLALRGRIADRGDYLVVTTPDDPGYYYGNLLVLPAAPQIGEVGFWTRRFEDEFRGDEIEHVTLMWDGIVGDVGARDELEAARFRIEEVQTMTARVRDFVGPIGSSIGGIEIRPLSPDDVLVTADLAFTIGDRHDDAYRRFLQRRTAWQSRLVENGSGQFWGAFDRGTLVGSLGLVALGDVARYQQVQTAASHRKRGIASTLLATAAQHASAETVVIRVLPEEDAARVYERLGLRVIEHTASACRYPAGIEPLTG